MEARLDDLKQELVMVKLNSMSTLAIRHATKDGLHLSDVPLVERVSRRILVGVHQLFVKTTDNMVLQQKIADRIRRDIRFDRKFKSGVDHYSKSWNEYFTKIANGYVPPLDEFSATNLHIVTSLKATVELRLVQERKLRCG